MYHLPVLLEETLELLQPQPGHVAVDCTLGGGGHARALAEKLGPTGHLIALDQDPDALDNAKDSGLLDVPCKVTLVHGNFRELDTHLSQLGLSQPTLDVLLADVGVSSHQLDSPERGFSFQFDGPLDMRMAQDGPPAHELIANLDANRLADILYQYGDIKKSRRLARAIVERAADGLLMRTQDLSRLVERVLGRPKRGQIHPATRAFQAIRIAVNDELGALEDLLDATPQWLKHEGRAAFIAFHSGEDRIVKHTLRRFQDPCTCPPRIPMCVCGAVPLGRVLHRKPIVAGAEELEINPRARSARLRGFLRLDSENV